MVIKNALNFILFRFLTFGKQEKNLEFRRELLGYAKKGLFLFGILTIVLLFIYIFSHVLLNDKSLTFSVSQFNSRSEILVIDKILIFIAATVLLFLSGRKVGLNWIRINIFVLVLFACLAMSFEDIAAGDVSFTTAYSTLALLVAMVTVPFKGWHMLLITLSVLISTAIMLPVLSPYLGADTMKLSLSQIIFLSVVGLILSGMASLIYLGRFEEFEKRKEIEELTDNLSRKAEKLKLLKEKSEALTEKVLKNEALKDHFFTNLSHDFKTPLTLILGPVTDWIRDKHSGAAGEFPEKDVSLIKKNAEKLLGLINQLLDLSKVESGVSIIQPESFNLYALLKEVCDSFLSMADKKNIRLELHAQAENLPVSGDPQHLRRVFENLLSNAFKFTPEKGSVKLNVSPVGAENEPGTYLISLSDTGQGIQQEDLPHIFDRFYQSSSSRHSGVGIGLAFVKEIIELHGGSISVENNPGKGVTFSCLLPSLQQVKTGKGDPGGENSNSLDQSGDKSGPLPEEVLDPEEIPATAHSLVIIDDNEELLDYMERRLSSYYSVHAYTKSREALEHIPEIMPDLIISDLMMPDPDGIQLVKNLRNDERLKFIPIILLTANSHEKQKLEGLQAGADDYIEKPFDTGELIVRVENLIDIRKALREKYGKKPSVSPSGEEISSQDSRFLEQVQEIIRANLENSNFGVDWLAGELHLSSRQAHRKIRKLTGMSAGAYIRMMRLEQAEALISNNWGNISEIALKVGFQDPKYFSSLFKQTFGQTPTEYQAQNG